MYLNISDSAESLLLGWLLALSPGRHLQQDKGELCTMLLIFKDVTLQLQNSFLSVPLKIRNLMECISKQNMLAGSRRYRDLTQTL